MSNHEKTIRRALRRLVALRGELEQIAEDANSADDEASIADAAEDVDAVAALLSNAIGVEVSAPASSSPIATAQIEALAERVGKVERECLDLRNGRATHGDVNRVRAAFDTFAVEGRDAIARCESVVRTLDVEAASRTLRTLADNLIASIKREAASSAVGDARAELSSLRGQIVELQREILALRSQAPAHRNGIGFPSSEALDAATVLLARSIVLGELTGEEGREGAELAKARVIEAAEAFARKSPA